MLIGPSNLGRFTKGDSITWKFTILIGDVPTTLGGAPAVKAYEEGSDVEFTGGITLTADYDGKTGLCELIVDTSNAAYHAGKHYDFFISAGSAGVVSQVGAVVGHLALIPEPADLRMVNGGSTGATAGKLELTKGLFITGDIGAAALKLVGGAADATNQASAGLMALGGAASADQLSSPGAVFYGGAGTATKAAGAGVIVGAGVKNASGDPAPGMFIVSSQPSAYGGHSEFDSAGDIPGVLVVGNENGNGVSVVAGTGYEGLAVQGTAAALFSSLSTSLFIGSQTATGGSSTIYIQGSGVGSSSSAAVLIDGGGTENNVLPGGAAVKLRGGYSYSDGITAGTAGPALQLDSGSNFGGAGDPGNAVVLTAVANDSGATGKAINALGQVAIAPTNTDDDALVLTPNGGGAGIKLSPDASGSGIEIDLTGSDGTGAGIFIHGDTEAYGIYVDVPNYALTLIAEADSEGVLIIGDGAGRSAVALQGTNDANALSLLPDGVGLSIDAAVEGSIGIIQSLMLANAANAGKTNGMGTATAHIRDLADSKNRVTATVDAEGNRSAITLDVT
jgi:hypothetical protein